MKKMPPHKSSLRKVYGEHDWGPTVDGRLHPRHPFDPGTPEISADVPLLTGTNLHEFVNGLDRPDADSMKVEELNRLVKEAFGDHTGAIIDAYRRDYPQATPSDLYATIAASSRVRRPAYEQAIRKAALGAAPAYSYVPSWRTPVLDGRPGSFHACEIAFTFDNAGICDHYSGALPRHSFCRSRSVPLGRALREPEIPIMTACRIGPNIQLNTGQSCSLTRPAKCATIRKGKV